MTVTRAARDSAVGAPWSGRRGRVPGARDGAPGMSPGSPGQRRGRRVVQGGDGRCQGAPLFHGQLGEVAPEDLEEHVVGAAVAPR